MPSYPYSQTAQPGSVGGAQVPMPPGWSPNNWQYPQPTMLPNMSYYSKPVNGLIRVTGIEGAKAYQLPPNSNAVLFDGNEAIFYLKSTDGAGFPTIRTFTFQELQPEQPEVQVDAYDTKAEMEKLSKQIAFLASEIEAMKPKEIKVNLKGAPDAEPDIQRNAAATSEQPKHIQQAGEHQVAPLWES